jgi:hypothetical protein
LRLFKTIAQAHSIQELARSKFPKLRDDVKQPQFVERPMAKPRTLQERDPAIRVKCQVRTSLRENHTNNRREEREMMNKNSHLKLVDKKRKREERKTTSSSNHSWEEKVKPTISICDNKRSFSRFGQEPISSDISSAGTHASAEEAGTSLSASRVDINHDRIDKDNYAYGHDHEHEDVNVNSSNNIKEKSVELNVVVNGFVDNNSCSLGESQSDKAGELSGLVSLLFFSYEIGI